MRYGSRSQADQGKVLDDCCYMTSALGTLRSEGHVIIPCLSSLGWEVFYQVTLILIPIRSTGLTSKKEGNCNVMIEGPADQGLHVTY